MLTTAKTDRLEICDMPALILHEVVVDEHDYKENHPGVELVQRCSMMAYAEERVVWARGCGLEPKFASMYDHFTAQWRVALYCQVASENERVFLALKMPSL